ncbi:MAG: hypothetical protein K1X66_00705 [Verrucomicrobiae bacterium]|nr:hypothetical protein [Verrucomicrobiae bacterium]
MKFKVLKIFSALSATSAVQWCLVFLFVSLVSAAAVPKWWITRGVINTNLAADNYGPVNVGQLKHVAFQAALELEEKLPNGAGDCLDLVESFSKTNGNYAPVNQGQLKYVAQFFYDRLIQEGYTNSYPWTTNKDDDANFALVNQGQLKFVFSFDLDKWKPKPPNWVDEDNDGLDDGVEVVLWGDLEQQGADDDADGDGVSNGQEAQDGTDPLDPNPPPNPDDVPSYAVVDFGLEGMGLKVNEVGDLVGRQGAIYFTLHKGQVDYWPGNRVYDLNEGGDILLCPKQGDVNSSIVNLESGEAIELGEWNSPKVPEAILQDPHMLSYSYQGLKSKRAYAMNDSRQTLGFAIAQWQYTYWYYDEYQNYKEATANYSEAIPMFWTPQAGMKIAFAPEYQFWMDSQEGFSINAQGAFVAGWYAHVEGNQTVDNCQYWASAGASAQFLGALDAGFSINNQNQIAGQKKDWALLVGAGGGGGFVLGGGYATSVNDKEETLINDSQGNAFMFRKNPESQVYEKFPVTQTLPDDNGWQITWANDINNDGAIAGQAIMDGAPKAVVMLPVELKQLNRPTSQDTTDMGESEEKIIKAHGPDNVAYITGKPQMPKLEARIGKGSFTGMMVEWRMEIKTERPERNTKDDMNIPEDGTIEIPMSEPWKIYDSFTGKAEFVGGKCTLYYHIKDAQDNYLGPEQKFEFKIRGKNPRDAEAKSHIVSTQGEYKYAWAMVQHESRGTTSDHVYNQFNANDPPKEQPNYGPPDGWGIAQLDKPLEVTANTKEVYSWKENIDKFYKELKQKKTLMEHFFIAVAAKWPNDQDAKKPPNDWVHPGTTTHMSALEAGTVTLYNGGEGCPTFIVDGVNCSIPWDFNPNRSPKWLYHPNSKNYLYKVLQEYEEKTAITE